MGTYKLGYMFDHSIKVFHVNPRDIEEIFIIMNVWILDSESQHTKIMTSELGTFEWWISGLRLDPLFFLISRLNNACSPLVINLQIN